MGRLKRVVEMGSEEARRGRVICVVRGGVEDGICNVRGCNIRGVTRRGCIGDEKRGYLVM